MARRVAGEPLEVVLGWAAFRGLRVAVAPDVFVPRRRTELLVDLALRSPALADPAGAATVLDLCCGAAAVARAIEAERPNARVFAADIDERATAVARKNVRDPASVFTGDLFEALPASLRGRIDVIVANAPYVPSAEIDFMPQEARLHEPVLALDGGPTGTELHGRIAKGAAEWLAPGGTVIIETSERQAAITASHLGAAGFSTGVRTADDVGSDGDATAVVGVHSVVPASTVKAPPVIGKPDVDEG